MSFDFGDFFVRQMFGAVRLPHRCAAKCVSEWRITAPAAHRKVNLPVRQRGPLRPRPHHLLVLMAARRRTHLASTIALSDECWRGEVGKCELPSRWGRRTLPLRPLLSLCPFLATDRLKWLQLRRLSSPRGSNFRPLSVHLSWLPCAPRRNVAPRSKRVDRTGEGRVAAMAIIVGAPLTLLWASLLNGHYL